MSTTSCPWARKAPLEEIRFRQAAEWDKLGSRSSMTRLRYHDKISTNGPRKV